MSVGIVDGSTPLTVDSLDHAKGELYEARAKLIELNEAKEQAETERKTASSEQAAAQAEYLNIDKLVGQEKDDVRERHKAAMNKFAEAKTKENELDTNISTTKAGVARLEENLKKKEAAKNKPSFFSRMRSFFARGPFRKQD